MSQTLEFHIDGRFQAVIRHDDASWVVHRAAPDTGARLREAARLAGLEEDDMICYLDQLCDAFLEPGET